MSEENRVTYVLWYGGEPVVSPEHEKAITERLPGEELGAEERFLRLAADLKIFRDRGLLRHGYSVVIDATNGEDSYN